MKRIELFCEFLASEDLRPTYDSAECLSFDFENDSFFCTADEDNHFVMFFTRLDVDFFNDQGVIAPAINAIIRKNQLITGWYTADSAFIAIGLICAEPTQLKPYLHEVLYALAVASESLEICAYDDGDWFARLVSDDGVTAGETKDGEAPDTRPVDNKIRQALLMNPSSETANKLRWHVDIEGVPFSLYIPKRRVPMPWPRQIAVSVSATPMNLGGPSYGSVTETSIDPRLPIVALLQLEAERKHTVRYRPLGDVKTWEVGKPYIPYSLLPESAPKLIQLEVRWDFSAGSWPK